MVCFYNTYEHIPFSIKIVYGNLTEIIVAFKTATRLIIF